MKLRRHDAASSSTGSAQLQVEEQEEAGHSNAPKKKRRKNSSNKTKTRNRKSRSSPAPSSSSVLTVDDLKTPRAVLSLKDTSPDSKCPICLDRFNNLSYLDTCLHRFCFTCIKEWSRNKAECPLCKQPFSSILHSVRSQEEFQKFPVAARRRPEPDGAEAAARRRPELDSVEATIAMVAAMAGDERMRLTLRRERQEDSRRNRRSRRNTAVPLLEWIVHAPPGTLLNQPLVPAEEERRFNMNQPGIVFDGLSALGAAGNMPPFIGDNRETRR